MPIVKPSQSEVGHFNYVRFTDEAVSGGKIAVDKVHQLEVLHGTAHLQTHVHNDGRSASQ
jgi:hypothetical protein